MKDDKQILLVAQKNAGQDDPEPGRHSRRRHLANGAAAAEAAGRHREGAGRRQPRAKIVKFTENAEFFEAQAEVISDEPGEGRDRGAVAFGDRTSSRTM
jgi:ATP-dependent Lon protease